MFLPETNFKLVNVSIVTYKNKETGDMYEVACFPNKLYEYFKNNTFDFLEKNKNEILQSECIYKNIAKGEESNKIKELLLELQANGLFEEKRNKNLQCIKYILDNGYERKNKETQKVELYKLEKELVCLLQDKIKYQGSCLTKDKLKEIVNKHHILNTKISVKKQVGEIMKKLENLTGFARVKYKIATYNGKDSSSVIVSSEKVPESTQQYEKEGIDFFVSKVEEESEEIC